MSYDGGDLAAWQKTAKEKLSELLGMDQFSKVDPAVNVEFESQNDDFTEIRFTFASEDGYRIPCHLLLPVGVENPPVMICVQGHTTGMHISLGREKYAKDRHWIENCDSDFCVRAVKEGFAAVALEQRNYGERGYSGEESPECHKETLVAFLMGRTTIGERVWDIMRLIDVLETDFKDRVDVKNVCLLGNSGGGTATAYAAALEDRLALAVPSCAMCSYEDSIGSLKHCECNYVPGIARYFSMSDLMAMACPKYFIQVSGIKDVGFLIDGAVQVYEQGRAAYEKNGAAERCHLVQGNGGHRFFADDTWPIIHRFVGR